ncbi:MAG: hypothetical protein ACOYUK_00585 [Patescibacteria group bacterium]
MANGNLVPVGHVFRVFPGKYGPYFGINVGSHGFVPHEELVLANGERHITVKVSTIEINRNRTNVAKPGNSCAIKTAHPLPDDFAVDESTLVFVDKHHADAAETAEQVISPRPPKFRDLELAASRRSSDHFTTQ